MEDVIASSGNIFEDLGLSEPQDRLAKADVAIRIEEMIAQRGLTQTQAARCMGLTQPQVSNIVRGRLTGFTLDRLFLCLNALGQDVEIRIRARSGAVAATYVHSPPTAARAKPLSKTG